MNTLDKILYLLKVHNIEQKDFAKAIGIGKQAISEWKSGKTKSYMRYIDIIAEYFDVSTDYLLCKTEEKQINNKNSNSSMESVNNLNELEQSLIYDFRRLPEHQQDKVINYINFLVIDEQMEASVKASAKDAV